MGEDKEVENRRVLLRAAAAARAAAASRAAARAAAADARTARAVTTARADAARGAVAAAAADPARVAVAGAVAPLRAVATARRVLPVGAAGTRPGRWRLSGGRAPGQPGHRLLGRTRAAAQRRPSVPAAARHGAAGRGAARLPPSATGRAPGREEMVAGVRRRPPAAKQRLVLPREVPATARWWPLGPSIRAM